MNIIVKRTIEEKIDDKKVVDYLLKDRGFNNLNAFLHPKHPMDISFKHFFNDKKEYEEQWKKTAKLLRKLHKSQGTIVVYTDYDADGITGGSVLWETLHKLGFKVMPHVPDRKVEGYGFSKKGIDLVRKTHNPSLIISVDHGIVAHEHIKYAKKLDIPIIITDHHQRKEIDPDAYAIFHTTKLSGSGVAYFFAKEILKQVQDDNIASQDDNKFKILNTNFKTDYLALASIGTIADLVSLTGESRSVAKYGLKAFLKVVRPGLKELLKEAGIENKKIATYDVGFIIAPRINAFGRLTKGIDALRLLCTSSQKRARLLAAKAGSTNKIRQDLVKDAVEDAIKKVDDSNKLIIVSSEDWEEGIIGLIASKIMNIHHKPTIVMTQSDGHAKASVRSIPGFDITSFLRSMQEYLVDVGGHAAAAGFTIEADQIVSFTNEAILRAEKEIDNDLLIKQIRVDIKMPLEQVSLSLAKKLEELEPFGIGNPTPVFESQAIIKDIQFLGKHKKHLKLLLQNKHILVECILFNGAEKFLGLKKGDDIDVVYTLQVNRWNGRENVQAIIKRAKGDYPH